MGVLTPGSAHTRPSVAPQSSVLLYLPKPKAQWFTGDCGILEVPTIVTYRLSIHIEISLFGVGTSLKRICDFVIHDFLQWFFFLHFSFSLHLLLLQHILHVLKGRFHWKIKTSRNVEVCLLIMLVTFFLPTNIYKSCSSISAIYFDPSGVL